MNSTPLHMSALERLRQLQDELIATYEALRAEGYAEDSLAMDSVFEVEMALDSAITMISED